jgi:hypothetical protein
MKLLPILLLAFVLSLGVACSSEEPDCSSSFTRYPAGHRCAPEPTPTPEYSRGEVIGLVQGMLRTHRADTCVLVGRNEMNASYSGNGKWQIDVKYRNRLYRWHLYEGTNAIEAVDGNC